MFRFFRTANKIDFARLSKNLTGWTSNLLFTGVVLVAAITFGRQITSWWATRSPTVFEHGHEVGTRNVGHSQLAGTLNFGDLPLTLGRKTVRGSQALALDTLRLECRKLSVTCLDLPREPGPFEKEMLQSTADLEPVEQELGKWNMYQLDAPIPMVVVCHAPETRSLRGAAAPQPPGPGLASGSKTGQPGPAGTSKGKVAKGLTRVLCWGFAFPVDLESERWTLLTCIPAGDTDRTDSDLPPLPIPPGARRSVSARSDSGGAIVTLAGEGDPQDWLRTFDAWFEREGWASGGWRRINASWYCRFDCNDHVVQIVVDHGERLNAALAISTTAFSGTESPRK